MGHQPETGDQEDAQEQPPRWAVGASLLPQATKPERQEHDGHDLAKAVAQRPAHCQSKYWK